MSSLLFPVAVWGLTGGVGVQIVTSVGPSGPNIEYLANLHTALHKYGAADPHIDALYAEAQRIRATK